MDKKAFTTPNRFLQIITGGQVFFQWRGGVVKGNLLIMNLNY